MTIVGPLLLASVMVVPIWLSMREKEETQNIEVIDETSGSIVETFPTVELLRTRLVALGYTPFISSGGSGTQNLNQVLAEGNTTAGEFIIISRKHTCN